MIKKYYKKARFSKEEKEKSDNMVVKGTEIYQKKKNKSWLSIEKNIMKWEKALYSPLDQQFLSFQKRDQKLLYFPLN